MNGRDPLRPSVADDLGSLADVLAPKPVHELTAGTVIGGHFVVEAVLGRGGMGAVYRAHDQTLDRRVAIKLGLRGADLARARREAVALARLAHPNVVTIHEIGEHDGVPFVAMELCEGGTARTWARTARRTWREILSVYVAAGRGLAAAHAAGLVHRDVKPDNIVLGSDGRARIADFGLARSARGLVGGQAAVISDRGDRGDIDASASTVVQPADGLTEPGAPPSGPVPTPPVSSPDVALTVDGAVVGTPRYMAPEQLDGGVLDARTDQYSFCLALEEAMAGRDAPRRVLAVIERGRAADPARRFPTMDALLEALGRASRRRRRWIVAAAAAVVAAALVATWSLAREHAPPAGCEPAARRLRGVWDPSLRAELVGRGDAVSGFVESIDTRIATWTTVRASACQDVRRGGEAAASGYARLRCLDQRLADIGAVVAFMRRSPDPRRAKELAGALPEVGICGDALDLGLLAPQPPNAELRGRVTQDRARLHLAYGLGNVGRFDEALALLDELGPRGTFPPLDAEADAARADVLGEQGDLDGSKRAYRSAISTAAAAHHPEVQITALLDLALVLAQEPEALDERARAEITGLVELADATLRGAGGDPALETHLLGSRAGVRSALGDLEGAIADARAAHRLRVEHSGPHAGVTVNAALNLGGTLTNAGHHAEARDLLAAALADADANLGDNHVILRQLTDQLSNASLRLGDLKTARIMRERSLAMAEATLDPDHEALDTQRINLSVLLAREGNFAEGIPLLEATLASRRRRGDVASDKVAMLHGNLAMSYAVTGRLDEAATHGELARASFEQMLGKDHPILVEAQVSLAMIYNDRGERPRAIETARRALALGEQVLAAKSPKLANPLATLAMILAPDQPAEARRLAERALALAAPPDGNPAVRGEAQLALAMSLSALDQKARALTTAEQAVVTLTEAGPLASPSRKRAEAWLAAQGR